MAGMCSSRGDRIVELKAAIQKYTPGITIRSVAKRPKNPPHQTRIGVFGAPGTGKSALINSLLYVTGDMWNHEAPEGFVEQRSTTMRRDVYDLTENLVICDNRGMTDFSQKFMGEVEYQLGGVRRDGDQVVWDKNRVQKFLEYMKSMRMSKSDCKLFEIHCAAIVMSGENLLVKADDVADLVKTIKGMTGEYPIFVITHKASAGRQVNSFKSGLLDLGVQFVFEIENYTEKNHFYDEQKHVELLEVLNQCTRVADKALQYAESQASACILL